MVHSKGGWMFANMSFRVPGKGGPGSSSGTRARGVETGDPGAPDPRPGSWGQSQAADYSSPPPPPRLSPPPPAHSPTHLPSPSPPAGSVRSGPLSRAPALPPRVAPSPSPRANTAEGRGSRAAPAPPPPNLRAAGWRLSPAAAGLTAGGAGSARGP